MLYRKEIDGLRAVAVLAVMLFHADFHLFSGGFVGVDVFFVISGFLITHIMLANIQAGTFSLVGFYERRARRILPALFVMMLICMPLAWVLFVSPVDLKDFSKSLVAIPLFVSNILFWRESGYFDISAQIKPLLHTWSLAVEEQYYLFFPLYMLVAWKVCQKSIWMLTVLIATISLGFAVWASVHIPAFNFYWLPSRIWEILAGALLPLYAYYNKPTVKPHIEGRRSIVAEALGLIGIAMIFGSVFAIDARTPWPSLWTLVPVVGTVLILKYARKPTLAAGLLSVRPVCACVFI